MSSIAAVEKVGIKELYGNLKKRAQDKGTRYSQLDVLVRMREGLKSPHSKNILSLYWWHLLQTDKVLYDRLKTATDEVTMRQILGGRVMTTYVQAEKTITVCSDMFPAEFFEIIDAYIDYTDEISKH